MSLSPKRYKYVTFRTGGLGSYALRRLPMGYVNASEVFQKAMEDITPIELKRHVTMYVDDILITTSTFEKHVEVLQKLLNVFSRNGLTIQINKSLICQKELRFLGFILTRKGIKIRPDKCQAIMNMPKPNSTNKVRSFLGSLGYNRRFIKVFTSLAHPLHKLTTKEVPFQWTPACENSFQALKKALMTAPILTPIDYNRKLILLTDACNEGVGACLCQMDKENGTRRMIAYYSRALNDHERAHTILEKEALAVVAAVKAFATYLRFITFEVMTVHQPLKYIFKESVSNRSQAASRILRWGYFYPLLTSTSDSQMEPLQRSDKPIGCQGKAICRPRMIKRKLPSN